MGPVILQKLNNIALQYCFEHSWLIDQFSAKVLTLEGLCAVGKQPGEGSVCPQQR